jgi:quercetin dioxygenase-like cupin family protein
VSIYLQPEHFTVDLSSSEINQFQAGIKPMLNPEMPKIETIVNPITGDRMTVLHSSYQSQGDYVKIRFDLPPGAKGSPLHYHTAMDERFTVCSGCLEMEVGTKGNRRILQPGESLQVSAGMHHSFCNSSSDWVTFTTENRSAKGFEQFMRGLYGLAIDHQVNVDGMPTNLLQLAVLLKRSDTVPVGVPLPLFKLLIYTLSWIAQRFNVEASLLKYWTETDRKLS